MTGDWIVPITRALIQRDTYDRTVAPALADLQYERRNGTGQGWLRGYVSVWRAIVGALAIDLGNDLAVAFGREARSSAWRVSANVFGGLFLLKLVVSLPFFFGFDDLGPDGYAAVFLARLPSVAAPLVPVLLVPAAFVFSRRLRGATRPILLSALIVSLVSIASSFLVVVPMTRVAEQYVQAAFWRARMDPAIPPRSLEEIRRELTVPLTRPDQLRARADRDRFEWHSIMSRGVSVFGFAVVGIGLARKRGWRVLNWCVLAYLVFSGILAASVTLYGRVFFPEPPAGLLSWTTTAAIFMAGTMVLIAGKSTERITTKPRGHGG